MVKKIKMNSYDRAITEPMAVEEIAPNLFLVKGVYRVAVEDTRYGKRAVKCTCPRYEKLKLVCKHQIKVNLYLGVVPNTAHPKLTMGANTLTGEGEE